MPFLKDFELILDVKQVLRAQGADPAALEERSPMLLESAERALREGMPLVEPKVLYRELEVKSPGHEKLFLSGGESLKGRFISENLGRAREVFIILCTIGRALERRVSEITEVNMVDGLALDGVGSAAVEALANITCRYFENKASEAGLQSSMPFHPGMEGWPVEDGQPQIFNLLDGEEIGVKLTSSCMMIPQKSLTMVIGIGPDMYKRGSACDYCSMKETCPYR